MGIVTGFAVAEFVGSAVGGSGGAGGGGGDASWVATLLFCGGAADGGAAYAGWRRGWKNERIEDCWEFDMF
jgi:hypothetical protein